jgi:hypothetical protein
MTKEHPRKLKDPLFLLLAIGLLSTFLVQSGELGTSDTLHRLQTAHSFWTHEPPVFRWEYPEFGLVGRGGRLYSWYGMGQSLLMLPADVAGSWLERLPLFAGYTGVDPTVKDIFVSFTTNCLVAALTILVSYRLLERFGFNTPEVVAGVLALFFATTHLHYTQNMTENNLILLLTLTGFCFQYEWLQSGRRGPLVIGSLALGFDLLTRLTTGLDLAACGFFLLLVLCFEGTGVKPTLQRAGEFARTAFPIYAIFLLIDRGYQFYRFGSLFNTYLTVFAIQQRQLDPSLPAAYPFEGRFRDGFLGPFLAPEKSVLLFDPLLVLSALAIPLLWKHLTPAIRGFSIGAWLLLFAYVSFYAKYTVWSGDFAWGDRYVSTAAQIAALLAVPIVMRYGSGWLRAAAWALIPASVAVQLASLCFWLPLEIYQMETLGHPTFVIGLRFKNIAAFALGKMSAWGLNNVPMTQDAWDYVHITTWNFLPFLLRRVGAAPAWVVDSLMVVWAAGLVALAFLFRRLRMSLREAD